MYGGSARDRVGPSRRQLSLRVGTGQSLLQGNTEMSIIDAISRGFFQHVRYLVDMGADVNERDESGMTPLMLCAFIEEGAWGVGLARTLLEKGAAGVCRDYKGLNVLHYACVYEKVELVRTLLSAIDFDLNQGDRHGNTALHYAADSGNAYVTKLLVDALLRYTMTVDKPNKSGVTPLIQAWKSGQVICANIIANMGKADLEWRDYVDSKSAKEWQEEAMNNMGQILSRQHKRRSIAALQLRRRSSSKCRRLFGRPKVRPRPAWAEKQKIQITVLENELLAMKDYDAVIRSASPAEMKSRLEHTFSSPPVETFITQLRHRPQTAPAHVRDYDNAKNDKSSIINVVSILSDRASSTCESVTNSWKTEIGALFHALQFQCTPSFRPSVKLVTNRDDTDLERPSSPTLSETASEDHQSNSSRKSSRRNSGLSNRGESKRRAPSQGQNAQSSGNSSNPKTKKNSNESLKLSIDSTSNESLTNATKNTPRRKSRDSRRSSVSPPSKDDLSDSSSQHTEKSSSSSSSSGSTSGKSKDQSSRGSTKSQNSKDISQRRDSDPANDSNHGFTSPLAAIDESQE